ncbi:GlxA family transcriptional regulator [Cupriavidus basilensis]|uniref:GlxA family transcriptional regulator n=1 Tax=Cupriavidus basilensis TaxID=68895 RepID=UPI0023E8DB38|nr:helix-turn-helix domain-containing protein [Cupriavidus basilensis]MDF3888091.1 helix-turn-helix domain-containing protein [Cupriavidus basilensis]
MARLDIIDSVSAMPKPLRIGLLLFPGCMPAGLFAFSDMLHAANRRANGMLFETHYVALRAGTVECAHGLSLHVSRPLDLASLDALLVPGFWAESVRQVDDMILANAGLVSLLAARRKNLLLWSYCSGVCLLAESGQLNDQAATVTWWLAEAMAQRYRKVKWQSERNCVVTARTATASGVNGYLPIAEALIERHVSPDVWRDLVNLMVLPRAVQPHRAFQAMSLIEQSSSLLRQLHTLVEQLPAEQITVQQLAEQLCMSERTLARKVRSETGVAIAAYARCIKLNQVSDRLIHTTSPVSVLSAELGFSSDSNMRRMFKELTSLTPLEYRQRFAR